MTTPAVFEVPMREPSDEELTRAAEFEVAQQSARAAAQVWQAAEAELAAARAALDALAQSGRAAGLIEAKDRVWELECRVDDAHIAMLDKRRVELAAEWPYRGHVAQRLRDYATELAGFSQRVAAAAEQANDDRRRAEYSWEIAQEGERKTWHQQNDLIAQAKTKRAARVQELRA